MRKIFCLALLSIFLACLPESLSAQDEYPVIISPPQVSVSVFTNWQLIKITYTVGYLDGYQPNFEEARPENMAFGLEIDPEQGTQLRRLNKRRYKNENYEDLVYYVRHIGEKKGEMIIPEQTFHYIKEEPGQSAEGQLVHEAKAPAGVLRYDSVLTKGADDIIDTINFGSFQKPALFWKTASVGLVVLAGLSLVLVFYWPVVMRKVGNRTGMGLAKKPATDNIGTGTPELLTPKEALSKFVKDLESRQTTIISLGNIHEDIRPSIDWEERAKLANGLKELLSVYVPTILNSDTPAEISLKIKDIPNDHRYKKSLTAFAKQLVYLDGLFYGQKAEQNLIVDLRDALLVGRDLERADAWWSQLKIWLKSWIKRRKK